MLKDEFADFDKLADEANDRCGEFFRSPALAQVKEAIQRLSAKYPKYSVELNCSLEVFDSKREASLPLLQIGVTSSQGGETYEHSADASPQRYWVKGEVCVVPHDRCPACWKEWDFKEKHGTCPVSV